MKLKEITEAIEQFAPLALQESYDNAGLITGEPSMEITGAVLCLDITEAILEEAVFRQANLIISHHPIVFHGLKSITGKNYVERIIIRVIRQNIALYAAHTNLDSVSRGMSYMMAGKLGLQNIRVLEPQPDSMVQIGVHTPESHVEIVRHAMAEAGAGSIGDYDFCTFNYKGEGTFRAKAGANPFVGKIGEIHHQPEIRTVAIAPKFKSESIVEAIRRVHPYEEMAYDITPLHLPDRQWGFGAVGDLPDALDAMEFLRTVKEKFNAGCLRHSVPDKETVQRIAVCSGSGGGMLSQAIRSGADVFITSEVKYNSFFDAQNRILLADIGHYESEIGVISLLYEILTKKFPTFALHKSGCSENPVNYL